MHQSTQNNLDIQYSYLYILCIYSICLQCLQIKNKKRNTPFCMCTCMYCIYLLYIWMHVSMHHRKQMSAHYKTMYYILFLFMFSYYMYDKYFIVTATEPPCFYSHSIWTKQSHSKEKWLLLKNECVYFLQKLKQGKVRADWCTVCHTLCVKSL